MSGKPFTLLVDIPLKPGRADEFMALFNEVFEAMKVEETFISATALRGAEDPDTILLCENWIDRENFMSVQLKRPYRHRYEARLPELLRSPRKLSFFEPIRPRPIAVFGERRIPPTISNGKSASEVESTKIPLDPVRARSDH
jgi:quinol monooxygenase YgiN